MSDAATTYTIEQMRDYLIGLIEANKAEQRLHNIYAEKAVEAAQVAMDHRLAGMNEIRGALADLTATMMTRSEAEVAVASLATKTRADMEALEAKSSAELQPIGPR